MKRANWRCWRPWLLLPLAMAGCQHPWRSTGMPPDPLFLSRQPVEGRAPLAAPTAVARIEPMPPPLPEALADRPSLAKRAVPSEMNAPDHIVVPPRTTPGTLTNRPVRP